MHLAVGRGRLGCYRLELFTVCIYFSGKILVGRWRGRFTSKGAFQVALSRAE